MLCNIQLSAHAYNNFNEQMSVGKITPDMVVVYPWQFALSSQLFTELTLNLTVYTRITLGRLGLLSGKLLVSVYYQPPGGHCDELLHFHHALISLSPSTLYLICGDFNAPGIHWCLNFPTSRSTIARAVCNLVEDHHLTQLMSEPTSENHIFSHAVQFNLMK